MPPLPRSDELPVAVEMVRNSAVHRVFWRSVRRTSVPVVMQSAAPLKRTNSEPGAAWPTASVTSVPVGNSSRQRSSTPTSRRHVRVPLAPFGVLNAWAEAFDSTPSLQVGGSVALDAYNSALPRDGGVTRDCSALFGSGN